MKHLILGYICPALAFCLSFIALFIAVDIHEPHYKKLPYNNGRMDKLEFDGHTYIGWTCNSGCSMTHDPNCKCMEKK